MTTIEATSLLNQAEQAINDQQYSKAISDYEKVLALDATNLIATINLSLLYAKHERLHDAKALLEAALVEQPNSIQLTKQLANVLKNLHHTHEAEQCYKKSIELDPNDASSLNNLGLLYYQQSEFQKAKQCYQQALVIEKGYLAAMYNLALAYRAGGDVEQAVACLLSLVSADPNATQAHFLLARLALEQKELQQAMHHFYRVASLHPDDVDVLHNIGVALLEASQFEEAKPYYETIVSLREDDHLAYYNLGVIAEQARQTSTAISCYQKALSLNQNHFASLNNLGVSYLAEQQPDKAKQYFEKALTIQSDNESIRYTLAALKGDKTIERSPNEYVTKLFDQYASNFDEHLAKGLDYQVPALLLAAVKQVVKQEDFKFSTLDLGCGTGLTGEAFKEHASRLVGVDLSSKMLEIAKQKSIYQNLVKEEVTTYLSDTSGSYQLIVAADVLVYFGRLDQLLERVKARLVNGGLFAFSIESLEGDAYTLTQSGRFAHSLAYLYRIAKHLEMKVLFSQQAITRLQNNKPVYGDIVVLQK